MAPLPGGGLTWIARALLPDPTASIAVACLDDDLPVLDPVVASWRDVLGIDVEVRT